MRREEESMADKYLVRYRTRFFFSSPRHRVVDPLWPADNETRKQMKSILGNALLLVAFVFFCLVFFFSCFVWPWLDGCCWWTKRAAPRLRQCGAISEKRPPGSRPLTHASCLFLFPTHPRLFFFSSSSYLHPFSIYIYIMCTFTEPVLFYYFVITAATVAAAAAWINGFDPSLSFSCFCFFFSSFIWSIFLNIIIALSLLGSLVLDGGRRWCWSGQDQKQRNRRRRGWRRWRTNARTATRLVHNGLWRHLCPLSDLDRFPLENHLSTDSGSGSWPTTAAVTQPRLSSRTAIFVVVVCGIDDGGVFCIGDDSPRTSTTTAALTLDLDQSTKRSRCCPSTGRRFSAPLWPTIGPWPAVGTGSSRLDCLHEWQQ